MGKQTTFSRKPSSFMISLKLFGLGSLFSWALLLGSTSITFGADLTNVANIDSSLQHLVEYGHNLEPQKSTAIAVPNSVADSITRSDQIRLRTEARFDEQGRALVHVHLDGNQPMEAIERVLTSLDAKVLNKAANYRHGVIAAYLPIGHIETLARTARDKSSDRGTSAESMGG
jgi:hypothetical protein